MNIIHIGGMDTYDKTHESGNTIIFNLIKQLPYNSKHILGLEKVHSDPDTEFIPLFEPHGGSQEGLEDKINPDILILYDSLLEPQTIINIYNKHKCPVIHVAMTHDFFTGGCSYPRQQGFDCIGYKKTCEDCPQGIANSHEILKDKLRMGDVDLYGVAVSTASLNMMKQSSVLSGKECELIPFPLEEIPVSLKSRDENKDAFGIPRDKFVMFWGSTQPECPRKGRDYLDKALNHLYELLKERDIDTDKFLLVTAGPPSILEFNQSQPFNCKQVGYVRTREQLADMYKLADVGLQTTIEDAGPMMCAECLANNTPLVSFSDCVAKDVIDDGNTGYIVDTFKYKEFAESILKVFLSEEDMGRNASLSCGEFNNTESVKQKWEDLFTKIKGKK